MLTEAVGLKVPVVDLKRNSLDDGPGIRTVVFFKGCPLDCVWCQNPETKSPARQIVYEGESCLGCNACVDVCPRSALKITPRRSYPVNTSLCSRCGACIAACPAGALRFTGERISVDNLLQKLLVDEVFFRNSGGGITLSGGEPTVHKAFVSELGYRLKARGIHVCLETCGMYDGDWFRDRMLPYLDLIYFDIKLFDSKEHEKYCGRPNGRILANLQFLINEAKEILLPRIPLIPGITTKPENLTAIREFLRKNGISRISLIPYNPLWLAKPCGIGLEPAYTRAEWLNAEEKGEIRNIFKEFEYRDF